MKDLIEFLASYPTWVKIVVVTLLAAIVLLLVLFRPNTNRADPFESPPVGAQVVIDTAHGQAEWRGLLEGMKSVAPNAVLLGNRFTRRGLGDVKPGVLVFALPYRQSILDAEVRAIKEWVSNGGGLLILGYYAADTHHGSTVSRLTREWGFAFNEDLLMPPDATDDQTREHVFRVDQRLGVRITPSAGGDHAIARDVREVVLLSSASIDTKYAVTSPEFALGLAQQVSHWIPDGPKDPNGMRPMIERWVRENSEPGPVVVAVPSGRGKVVICGTWKVASQSFADNSTLMRNVIEWLRPT